MKNKFTLTLVLLSLLLFLTGCVSNEITEEEKALLVTIDDLQYFDIGSYETEGCEIYESKTNLDGSLELEYEFDASKNEKNQDYLSIISQVEINKDMDEAAESFKMTINAYKLGFKIGNRKSNVTKDESLFKWGDDDYSGYIGYEDAHIGNIIVTRKDNKIFSFIILGIYFDDKELLMELLEPKLALLEAHK